MRIVAEVVEAPPRGVVAVVDEPYIPPDPDPGPGNIPPPPAFGSEFPVTTNPGVVTVSWATSARTITENDSVELTAQLSGSLDNPASVDVVSGMGTALAGRAYLSASRIQFPAGSTDPQTITVITTADAAEGDVRTFEAVLVPASTGLSIDIGDPDTAVVTINDAAQPGGTPTWSLDDDDLYAYEGGPERTFFLSLDEPAIDVLTFAISAGPASTAFAGTDYNILDPVVDIPIGESFLSYRIAFPNTTSTQLPQDPRLVVVATKTTGTAIDPTPGGRTFNIDIIENDGTVGQPKLSLVTTGNLNRNEGTSALIVAQLASTNGTPMWFDTAIDIPFSLTYGAAGQEVDFDVITPSGGSSFSFGARESTASVTIAVVSDPDTDSGETATLSLINDTSTPAAWLLAPTNTSVTVTATGGEDEVTQVFVPEAVNTGPGARRHIQGLVAINPPNATIPQYSLAIGDADGEHVQVIGMGRDGDGRYDSAYVYGIAPTDEFIPDVGPSSERLILRYSRDGDEDPPETEFTAHPEITFTVEAAGATYECSIEDGFNDGVVDTAWTGPLAPWAQSGPTLVTERVYQMRPISPTFSGYPKRIAESGDSLGIIECTVKQMAGEPDVFLVEGEFHNGAWAQFDLEGGTSAPLDPLAENKYTDGAVNLQRISASLGSAQPGLLPAAPGSRPGEDLDWGVKDKPELADMDWVFENGALTSQRGLPAEANFGDAYRASRAAGVVNVHFGIRGRVDQEVIVGGKYGFGGNDLRYPGETESSATFLGLTEDASARIAWGNNLGGAIPTGEVAVFDCGIQGRPDGFLMNDTTGARHTQVDGCWAVHNNPSYDYVANINVPSWSHGMSYGPTDVLVIRNWKWRGEQPSDPGLRFSYYSIGYLRGQQTSLLFENNDLRGGGFGGMQNRPDNFPYGNPNGNPRPTGRTMLRGNYYGPGSDDGANGSACMSIWASFGGVYIYDNNLDDYPAAGIVTSGQNLASNYPSDSGNQMPFVYLANNRIVEGPSTYKGALSLSSVDHLHIDGDNEIVGGVGIDVKWNWEQNGSRVGEITVYADEIPDWMRGAGHYIPPPVDRGQDYTEEELQNMLFRWADGYVIDFIDPHPNQSSTASNEVDLLRDTGQAYHFPPCAQHQFWFVVRSADNPGAVEKARDYLRLRNVAWFVGSLGPTRNPIYGEAGDLTLDYGRAGFSPPGVIPTGWQAVKELGEIQGDGDGATVLGALEAWRSGQAGEDAHEGTVDPGVGDGQRSGWWHGMGPQGAGTPGNANLNGTSALIPWWGWWCRMRVLGSAVASRASVGWRDIISHNSGGFWWSLSDYRQNQTDPRVACQASTDIDGLQRHWHFNLSTAGGVIPANRRLAPTDRPWNTVLPGEADPAESGIVNDYPIEHLTKLGRYRDGLTDMWWGCRSRNAYLMVERIASLASRVAMPQKVIDGYPIVGKDAVDTWNLARIEEVDAAAGGGPRGTGLWLYETDPGIYGYKGMSQDAQAWVAMALAHYYRIGTDYYREGLTGGGVASSVGQQDQLGMLIDFYDRIIEESGACGRKVAFDGDPDPFGSTTVTPGGPFLYAPPNDANRTGALPSRLPVRSVFNGTTTTFDPGDPNFYTGYGLFEDWAYFSRAMAALERYCTKSGDPLRAPGRLQRALDAYDNHMAGINAYTAEEGLPYVPLTISPAFGDSVRPAQWSASDQLTKLTLSEVRAGEAVWDLTLAGTGLDPAVWGANFYKTALMATYGQPEAAEWFKAVLTKRAVYGSDDPGFLQYLMNDAEVGLNRKLDSGKLFGEHTYMIPYLAALLNRVS